MRRFVAASQNPAPQKTKEGHSLQNEKKHPSCGQKVKPVCDIYVVNLKIEKINKNSGINQKKNPLFSRENSGFLVRVTGFEPMAHRVDTLRAIRRRISMQDAAGSKITQNKKHRRHDVSGVFWSECH